MKNVLYSTGQAEVHKQKTVSSCSQKGDRIFLNDNQLYALAASVCV